MCIMNVCDDLFLKGDALAGIWRQGEIELKNGCIAWADRSACNI